jgi:3-oxoacyl-[acyl-carrier protein] reductase
MPNDNILITGASSDIGLALMQHLLETTSTTVLAHSFSSGQRIGPLHASFGERVVPINADLSDSDSVLKMAADVKAICGAPSGFVHLPALPISQQRFTKFEWNHFQTDFNIQVRSAVLLLQNLLPAMAKLSRARIVFMLSSAVHNVPPKYMAMYTTVKYAQLGLMRSIAAEYAASSVRVNSVSPGMVDTRFLRDVPEVAVQLHASSNPLGRNATPADLLGALTFLLSPASDYTHGIDIPIAAGTVM